MFKWLEKTHPRYKSMVDSRSQYYKNDSHKDRTYLAENRPKMTNFSAVCKILWNHSFSEEI